MNVFFFGGTFDPPHLGHKLIYKHCINLCDKFIFVPVAQSPEKNKPIATIDQRINMLESLIDISDKNKVLIDRYEIDSGIKPNYTINTIIYLKKKFRKSSIHMVLGADQYEKLSSWKNYDKIIDQVEIVCFNRNKSGIGNDGNKVNFIDYDYKISSSIIRRKISNGNINKVKNHLTEEINHLICDNDLYLN